MRESKYKIDTNDDPWLRESFPIALYERQSFLGVTYWDRLESFKTIDGAAEQLQKIVGLPRYYNEAGRRL